MDKKLLFLIDGHFYCYRAYYAIRELKTSKGFPTNAIFGFFNMLNKIIQRERPDYMAVSFDTKVPTFRHKKFKQYKIHRKPMPEELVIQLPWIKELLKTLNISIYEKDGYEADDVIATLASKFSNQALQIYIGSSDKDILQLVNEDLKVYRPYNKSKSIFGIEEVKQKFGVHPNRIADYLALKGDSSDNIPGIPGIGKKYAAKLVNQYGSIEEILSHIEQIKPSKIKEKFEEYKDRVLRSKELTKLDTNILIDVRLKDLKLDVPDREKLISVFQSLEFNKLIEKLQTGQLL